MRLNTFQTWFSGYYRKVSEWGHRSNAFGYQVQTKYMNANGEESSGETSISSARRYWLFYCKNSHSTVLQVVSSKTADEQLWEWSYAWLTRSYRKPKKSTRRTLRVVSCMYILSNYSQLGSLDLFRNQSINFVIPFRFRAYIAGIRITEC